MTCELNDDCLFYRLLRDIDAADATISSVIAYIKGHPHHAFGTLLRSLLHIYICLPYNSGGLERSFIWLRRFKKRKTMGQGRPSNLTVLTIEGTKGLSSDVVWDKFASKIGDYNCSIVAWTESLTSDNTCKSCVFCYSVQKKSENYLQIQ